jgi:menaquinone-9 beta-reductase
LSARGEMHIGIDHYAGVAPLPDDVANVCVVRELKRTQRDDRLNAEQVIEDAITRNLALRPRFARARRVSTVASLGPLAVDATTAGCPGLLLAGDAAGFIDPMTGDGMRFALRGGELAAEAALQEFERNVPAHEHLRAARQREFSGKWRLDRTLRSLVASPRSLAVVEAIGSRWPSPVNLLVGVAGDVRLARG